MFDMRHAHIIPPANPHTTLGPSAAQALEMASIAWGVLLSDITSQVMKMTDKDAKQVMSTHHEQDENWIWAKCRIQSAKKWSESKQAFSHGDPRRTTNSWKLLSEALSPTRQDQRESMGTDPRMIPIKEVADVLSKMTLMTAGAPAIAQGHFQHVIEQANLEIARIGERSGNPWTSDRFAHYIWLIFLKNQKVDFIPWTPPTRQHGRAQRFATTASWVYIEADQTLLGQAHTEVSARGDVQHVMTQHQKKIISLNPSRSWKMKTTKISEIAQLLKLTALPDDFVADLYPRDKSRLGDTYRYVYRSFDPSNDLHRLCLIAGFLFFKNAPNLYRARHDTKGIAVDEDITERVRSEPWISSPDGKGIKERKVVLAQKIVTLSIALLDEDSPLLADDNTLLGKSWTEQHSRNLHHINMMPLI
jgi:hypothetical protein